jgi:hypothetical protein
MPSRCTRLPEHVGAAGGAFTAALAVADGSSTAEGQQRAGHARENGNPGGEGDPRLNPAEPYQPQDVRRRPKARLATPYIAAPPLGTSTGSNVPARSRGTLNATGPDSAFSIFAAGVPRAFRIRIH